MKIKGESSVLNKRNNFKTYSRTHEIFYTKMVEVMKDNKMFSEFIVRISKGGLR